MFIKVPRCSNGYIGEAFALELSSRFGVKKKKKTNQHDGEHHRNAQHDGFVVSSLVFQEVPA